MTNFYVSAVCATASAMLLMNILASKCLFSYKFLAVDAGILVSWIAFAASDAVLQVYGKREANRLALIGCIFGFIGAAILLLAVHIPGVWRVGKVTEEVESAINFVVGSTFVAVLASSLAAFCGMLLNNFLHHAILKRQKTTGFNDFCVASGVSTFFSQMFENFFFCGLICYSLFDWTLLQCAGAAVVGAVLESFVVFIFIPVIFFMIRKAKRKMRDGR